MMVAQSALWSSRDDIRIAGRKLLRCSANYRASELPVISQAKSGITAVYDLYNDHREVNPIVVGGFHFKEPFKRMRARHELWKKRYPDREHKRGPAYTGISNARPETIALSKPPVDFENLPFDPLEFISHLDELPLNLSREPGFGE